MTASTAELVHVRYQKLKNIHFSVTDVQEGHYHEHSSLEVGMVLAGTVSLRCNDRVRTVTPGGLLLFNAYDSHILTSEQGAQVLFLQLAPGFGKEYFAGIANVEFDNSTLDQLPHQAYSTIRDFLLSAAKVFFEEPPVFGLECAGLVTHMVTAMLRYIPYGISTDAEFMTKKKKIGRHQRIASFMEQHYREKLSLDHLAKAENITTAYMSRVFGELFGRPFQEYLSELRLRKAMPLLMNPNMYLVDVCMECGFSDTRYLNAVCQKQYGCSAMQLRDKLIRGEVAPATQGMIPDESLQYTDAEALRILHSYLDCKEEV